MIAYISICLHILGYICIQFLRASIIVLIAFCKRCNAIVPRRIHNHPVQDIPAACPVGSGLCIFRREHPVYFPAAIHFSTTQMA